jgi:hypothetical protein
MIGAGRSSGEGLPSRPEQVMRNVLTIPAMLAVLYLPSTGAARAEVCNAEKYGGVVCGDGDKAIRVIDKTKSPSGKFAFAWRSADGVASGGRIPPDDIENLLIRVADGAVLAKLGGIYWANGEMRANRYDVVAAWSSDSRAVIEVSNDRWGTYSFAYYALDRGDKAATLDLRALLEPALKAKLPPNKRESHSFRVREDLPVKLEPGGRAQFTAMLYVPKSEASLDYSVRVDIALIKGQPKARIVSMQRARAP